MEKNPSLLGPADLAKYKALIKYGKSNSGWISKVATRQAELLSEALQKKSFSEQDDIHADIRAHQEKAAGLMTKSTVAHIWHGKFSTVLYFAKPRQTYSLHEWRLKALERLEILAWKSSQIHQIYEALEDAMATQDVDKTLKLSKQMQQLIK